MYLLKVKSTTLEKGMKYGVFIANFERISLFSVFLLLTLNRWMFVGEIFLVQI